MTESPPTRATLLIRLRDRGDSEAWSEFHRTYGPMLYRFLRSRGLQDADASDLIQEVLRSVGTAIERLDYQREKGSFHAWLFTITRNKLYNFFEKRKRDEPFGNVTVQYEVLSQAVDYRDDLRERWDLEHQRQLALQAIEIIKPSVASNTWSAFELTAMRGLSAVEAGKRIGLTTGAIYVARSRVTAKIRTEIERMLTEVENGDDL